MFFQDLTRATGLGVCLSQLPALMFVMLYYREPHAVIYTVKISNSTTMETRLSADEYGMSVIFLITSALCVIFSMMTSQLQEAQLIDNMVEFTDEIATQVHIWSAVLWGVAFFCRVCTISMLCSPVDLYFVLVVVLAHTYSLQLMCVPRVNGKRADNLSIILFMFVVGIVYVEMQSTHGLKLVFWTSQVIGDLLLMVGHSYDSQCNMETVANCRVFYCCFVSCLLILLYIA